MHVQDIMVAELVTIRSTTTIANAAAVMLQRGAALLFVTHGDRLLGVITDSDILYDVVAQGFPTDRKVWEFMELNPPVANPEMDIIELISIMDKYRLTRLPVVDNGKLIASVTLADIAEKLDLM
ncbi:MAG TPA: CBS domain-containing protein [Candidatus Aquicultor sp.]